MQIDVEPQGVAAEPPSLSPVTPPSAAAVPDPSGPVVRLLLVGETEPRLCRWDPADLTMLADLDRAIDGIATFDIARLWHMLALLWVCSTAREEMDLREFGRRFPWGDERRREQLIEGAKILWRQIT